MDLTQRFPAGTEWTGEESLAIARTIHAWADRELVGRRATLREGYDVLLLPAYTTLLLELGLQRYLWPAPGEEVVDRAEAALALTLALEQVGRGDVGLAVLLSNLLAPSAALALDGRVPDAARSASAALLLGGRQGAPRPQICALVPAVLDLTEQRESEPPLFEGRRLQATARREGDGWIVDGEAMLPLAAGSTATLFGLLCQVEGNGSPSPALLLVEGEAAGISRGEPILQTGLAACRNAPVTFRGVRAPAAALALCGPEACHGLLCWYNLLAAAACSGALLAAHEILADWGDNRVIKGKGQLFKDNPLCASLMADLSQRLALSRTLVLDLARRLGRPDLYGEPGEAALRLHGLGVAHHVAAASVAALDQAMELMGSAGYATEWNLERYWRDVKTLQLQLGSAELGRVALARHSFGSRAI